MLDITSVGSSYTRIYIVTVQLSVTYEYDNDIGPIHCLQLSYQLIVLSHQTATK